MPNSCPPAGTTLRRRAARAKARPAASVSAPLTGNELERVDAFCALMGDVLKRREWLVEQTSPKARAVSWGRFVPDSLKEHLAELDNVLLRCARGEHAVRELEGVFKKQTRHRARWLVDALEQLVAAARAGRAADPDHIEWAAKAAGVTVQRVVAAVTCPEVHAELGLGGPRRAAVVAATKVLGVSAATVWRRLRETQPRDDDEWTP